MASTLSVAEVCASLQLSWVAFGKVLGGRTLQLATSTSTDRYDLVTEWLPYAWADKVKLGLILTGREGNLEVQVAYQTAQRDVEDVDAWADVPQSTARSANGEWCSGEKDLTATGKMWVRFGVRCCSTSGSASGTVTIVVTVR